MSKLSFNEWSILSDLQIIDAIQEDYEYSMARSELKTAQAAISRLMKKLQGEGELEAWIQSKITKASDYIDTVADYIDSGESETEEGGDVKEAVLGRYEDRKKTLRPKEERLGKKKETLAAPAGPKITKLKPRGPRRGEATASQVQGWRGSDRTNTNRRGQSAPQAKALTKEEFVDEELKSHKSVESIAKKHRMDPSDIQKQLEMGIKIEHEHVTDKDTATDIALQHLDEIPDYYTRLKKMEASAKKDHKKFKDVIEDTEILDAEGNLFATVIDIIKGSDDKFKGFTNVEEGKKGLWDNIHARREKGLPRKKPGQKGYPKTLDIDEDLAQARKNVGASKCWPGKVAKGTKIKGGKEVPNCVPVKEEYSGERYCEKCGKNEKSSECKYGEKYWAMFSIPSNLAPKKPFSTAKVHPANEALSFEVRKSSGAGALTPAAAAQLGPKAIDLQKKKAAGVDLPLKSSPGSMAKLADAVIYPGELTTEDYQRLQSTGSVYTILFSWRGRPMMNLQLFFPTQKRPSKDEVKSQVDKLYPGAVVMQWYPSPTDPTKPIVVIQK